MVSMVSKHNCQQAPLRNCMLHETYLGSRDGYLSIGRFKKHIIFQLCTNRTYQLGMFHCPLWAGGILSSFE